LKDLVEKWSSFPLLKGLPHPTNPIPQLFKPFCIIGNLKGVAVSPVRASTISYESGFADIDTTIRVLVLTILSFFVSILITAILLSLVSHQLAN
jgi:hypothetical protein